MTHLGGRLTRRKKITWAKIFKLCYYDINKALAIAIRTIAIAIAIVAKKAIEYCNMQ